MKESNHSSKTERSRLNALYIIATLKKYSNEETPLSISEITEKINFDFSHLAFSEKIISNDTVSRTLETLTTYLFDSSKSSFFNDWISFGFAIHCVMKNSNKYITYRTPKSGKAPKKYYYYQSIFTNAEITTLIDAVETYNYFSDDDLFELITKLTKIQPLTYASEKYVSDTPTLKDSNSLLFLNIDALDLIIKHKNCARITYCSYNYKKELQPKKGYPKIIEPIALMWSNGYYYLVAYNPDYDNTVNFRIDRISDVEEIEQQATHVPTNFNASRYRLEHPVMYGGVRQTITLLCRDTGYNTIMNLIMDEFGKPAKIIPAQDHELIKYLGHDTAFYEEIGEIWYKISFQSTPGGVEQWATQHCNDCIIISPTSSAQKVKKRLEDGLRLYQAYPN